MKNLLPSFQAELQSLGYTHQSITLLISCTKSFLEQYEPGQTTTKEIESYYQYLQNRSNQRKPNLGLSAKYINHHIYSLKVFFSWLQRIQLIESNPMSSLHFSKTDTAPRIVLSEKEIKDLYQSCETPREKALLSLYYGCGLRRSEGEKLELKDLHFSESLLYVRSGKGGKRRVVPMGEKVIQDFKNYLNYERMALPDETAFLCNYQGKKLRASSCYNLFKKLCERAELKASVGLHHLRHSIATHLLLKGLPVEYVRDFLGHKYLESTQVYLKTLKHHQL